MRSRLLSAAIAGLLLLVVSANSALAEKRVALIIGNAAYQIASPLTNTVNDAKAMANLFTKAGFDVVESRTDLGVVEFKRTIRDFMFTARDADIAVVYFAGHGIEVRGSNFLIPVDAKLRSDYDADDEAIALERLILAVEPVKQLRLIILDACRDNPFIKRMQRNLAARAVTGGLASVEPSTGNTLIAYAAKAGSMSFDGAGPNSPFTTALVRHLVEPGLDIRIALGRVRDEVMKETGNRQEPFVYGSLGGTTIALVPPAAEPAKAGPVETRYDIQRDYEFAERVGTQKAWESFLQVHSTGYYAGLARAQLAKLNQTAEKALPPVIASGEPPARNDSASSPRKSSPPVIAAGEPQARNESASAPKKPPPSEQRAKLEPKPAQEIIPPPAPTAVADPCKRDQEKLTRLRADPVRDDIIRLERELGCERLRPQVVRLRESVVGDLPAAADKTPVGPATAIQHGGEAESREQVQQRQTSDEPRVSADPCTRDQDRLARLRALPVRDEVLRFERELACERLRPQVIRLRESVGAN